MKLVGVFDDFLKETVNLNQSRIDLLTDSIPAIKSFIRESGWGPRIRGFEEQGSWAHDTIIRPVEGDAFDADLLVMVDHVDGWTAADYVTKLGEIFSKSSVYGQKSKTWDYCVTIMYAGERSIDVTPCVVGRSWEASIEVCNRATGELERSEPVEYTNWLKERNGYSGSNSFRKVTRLLKYLRDIKHTFTCPSVLLTTLIGYRIEWFDKDSLDFADTPTTLKTIVGRLDDWLQLNPSKPAVTNPKLPGEDFASVWTITQYSNFRDFVHKYRGWIDEAFNTEGRSESIAAWQRVFGPEFARGDAIKVVADSASEGVARARGFLASTAAHLNELVDVVRNFGLSVLPESFSRPPHMQSPPWSRASNVSTKIGVLAEWRSNTAAQGKAIRMDDVLPPRGGLFFRAFVNGGDRVPHGYSVQWRITNTGVVALAKQKGRGGFYAENRADGHWEALEYRGIHIAEAFIIRRSDQILVGQSDPFYVIIE
jgi:hypothetical protein